MNSKTWIMVIFAVLVGGGLGVFGGNYFAKKIPLISGMGGIAENTKPLPAYVRLLVIGEDDTGSTNTNGLSDTLAVFAINTKTKEIRAISIPRDTRVEIARHGTSKINAANVYGGPELARDVISQLLGTKIDYYVKINTAGLRELVDMLGGVYIKIDKNMFYQDKRGGLYINLKAGPEKQLLNGKQAEGFVRFRHDAYGDSGYKMEEGEKVAAGRIVRQQIFFRALANRLLALPDNDDRLDVLKEALDKGYIESDLGLRAWKDMMEIMKDMDTENIQMVVLPGEPGYVGNASYWLPDDFGIREAVAQYMYFDPLPEKVAKDEKAKVEVLNGSGIAGMAKLAGDKLKTTGFDVVKVDNAKESDLARTTITVYNSKTDAARKAKSDLDCGVIKNSSDTNENVDITIIIGKDYNTIAKGD